MRVYWPPSVWVVVSEQSVGWLGGTHYVCEEHLDDILVAVDDVGLLEFYQYHPPKES
jgi:hypothetical protein